MLNPLCVPHGFNVLYSWLSFEINNVRLRLIVIHLIHGQIVLVTACSNVLSLALICFKRGSGMLEPSLMGGLKELGVLLPFFLLFLYCLLSIALQLIVQVLFQCLVDVSILIVLSPPIDITHLFYFMFCM